MAYDLIMIFIEPSIFTKEIQRLISDDSYRMLQTALMLRPDAGKLIRGSGGLRKIRWKLPGTGKRGALRIISSCSVEWPRSYYHERRAF